MIQSISEARKELPGWLLIEIAPRADSWVAELERHIDAGDNALTSQLILPPFFDALGLPDAQARKDRLAQRAIRVLMKGRKYAHALEVLERQPKTEANQRLAAECHEESGQFATAAAEYLELGEKDKALRCFRSAPDFDAALRLVREMEGHPARQSLEWLAELNNVLGRRPDNFNRTMTSPEKKLLEAMLERGLGVQRKKPAVKRPAAKKAAPTKRVQKPAPKRAPKEKPEYF